MAKIREYSDKRRADKHALCPYCKSSKIQSNRINYNKNKDITRTYECLRCGKYSTFPVGGEDVNIAVISDTHCGHRTGLTPPSYQTTGDIYSEFQKETWTWFTNMINLHKPFDILIANGDLIDGRQEKSGGSELIAGDRYKQGLMAIDIINQFKAQEVYITRGTPYHVGRLEQWEDIIADRTDAIIDNKLKIDVNGCIIDVKHKTGRSNIPHGRFTQMARTSMWNDLMNSTNGKKANVIIRSHVHYHIYGGHSNNRLFFTTACLQGATDYGEKECEGSITYGFHLLKISKDGLIADFKTFEPKFETSFNTVLKSKI